MFATRSSVVTAALLLVTLAFPGAAFASAISIKLVTSVPAGQVPRLTVTANQPVDNVEVILNRDDGKVVEESVGTLTTGAWRDVTLDATVGKRSYSGRVTCVVDGSPRSTQVSFQTYVSGDMNVSIDKSRVDLVRGRMEVRASVPEVKIELKVFSAADGAVVVDQEQSFAGHTGDEPLVLTWKPQPKDIEIGRIDVKVSDPNGAFRSFSFFPWSIFIPHEEVAFATDSAAIAPAETPKLEASLAKIHDAVIHHAEMGAIKLYIAGHTDTVGAAKYNLGLSLKRAQSIASWFRKSGLGVPIVFEGFGEQALRVQTPDNTDEPRNRRVDYILSVEDPEYKASDFRPAWKTLK